MPQNLLNKTLLLFLKYIPVLTMVVMVINAFLIIHDIYFFNYIGNYLFGNSLSFSILLIVCSYVFLYCIWQRVIIYTNLILIIFGCVWNCSNFDLNFLIYYMACYCIMAIGIITALMLHVKCKRDRRLSQERKYASRYHVLLKNIAYIIVKWAPLVFLVVVLLNNTFLVLGVVTGGYGYIVNYVFGNSFSFASLLYVLSLVFNLGKWNRTLTVTNALVLLVSMIEETLWVDVFGCEMISDFGLYCIFIVLQMSGLALGLILSVNEKESVSLLR